jgi:hypothetical protein
MGNKHLQEVNNIKHIVFVGKIIKDVEENFTKNHNVEMEFNVARLKLFWR